MAMGDDVLIEQARTLAENLDDFREWCVTRDAPEAAVAALYEAAVAAWAALDVLDPDRED